MNVHWNSWNSNFVSLMQLLLLCEKTMAIALAQLGLMTSWQANEMQRFLKLYTR